MNDNSVCRTAPAKPGLLIMGRGGECYMSAGVLRDCVNKSHESWILEGHKD